MTSRVETSEGTRKKRAYNSPARAAAASERRERVLDAAWHVLRESDNVTAFTLEAVATAAGVTRLTVYNQFGSRRALMEAVFDRVAITLRLENLGRVVCEDEPVEALRTLVKAFSNFWQDVAVMRLQDAIGSDPEFDQALLSRHERRRALLKTLTGRFAPDADPSLKAEVVDTIFALTSPQMYRLLSRGRSGKTSSRLVEVASMEALGRFGRR
jgi:AcrR family transcriptional regulator